MPLFPETPPLQTGYLEDQDGHSVFWETFGNTTKPALLLLHGGPGSGIAPRMPRLFDPTRWHIVAMDQRGSGRSRPHAGDSLTALKANTTDHLIHDIERLRQHLGLSDWTLYGSSWGATLAQAYAHAHPVRVSAMILAAVTTSSRFEDDNLYGYAGHFLPEAFERFQAGAPDAAPGASMAAAYGDLLTCGDPERERAAAEAWCAWEAAVLQVDPRAETPRSFTDPRFALGFARVVTHYFRHLAWLDPPLLDRTEALASIPSVLINSRQDLSTPLSIAWRLHRAWPKSELVVIPGALHGTLYGPLSDAVIDAGNRLATKQGV
ncbi:alpha/beta fold hydrolase [Thalassococcus sp. S3]|uniref:alpha/beta fold hydrolase n=1 Tax=Thalassococcus sp. S3 TaxID=2017482 RepID=UPI0010243095|nr:alpha/beta fold hydrolase [Thalassococcus sp. S3]QBF30377.1 prolyl aminopeptidase [Thalassococcus sp. S3]